MSAGDAHTQAQMVVSQLVQRGFVVVSPPLAEAQILGVFRTIYHTTDLAATDITVAGGSTKAELASTYTMGNPLEPLVLLDWVWNATVADRAKRVLHLCRIWYGQVDGRTPVRLYGDLHSQRMLECLAKSPRASVPLVWTDAPHVGGPYAGGLFGDPAEVVAVPSTVFAIASVFVERGAVPRQWHHVAPAAWGAMLPVQTTLTTCAPPQHGAADTAIKCPADRYEAVRRQIVLAIRTILPTEEIEATESGQKIPTDVAFRAYHQYTAARAKTNAAPEFCFEYFFQENIRHPGHVSMRWLEPRTDTTVEDAAPLNKKKPSKQVEDVPGSGLVAAGRRAAFVYYMQCYYWGKVWPKAGFPSAPVHMRTVSYLPCTQSADRQIHLPVAYQNLACTYIRHVNRMRSTPSKLGTLFDPPVIFMRQDMRTFHCAVTDVTVLQRRLAAKIFGVLDLVDYYTPPNPPTTCFAFAVSVSNVFTEAGVRHYTRVLWYILVLLNPMAELSDTLNVVQDIMRQITHKTSHGAQLNVVLDMAVEDWNGVSEWQGRCQRHLMKADLGDGRFDFGVLRQCVVATPHKFQCQAWRKRKRDELVGGAGGSGLCKALLQTTVCLRCANGYVRVEREELRQMRVGHQPMKPPVRAFPDWPGEQMVCGSRSPTAAVVLGGLQPIESHQVAMTFL